MRRVAIVLVAPVLLMSAAHAYTLNIRQSGGDLITLRWPTGSLPIPFQVNDQTGPQLPNVTDESDPVLAIQLALQQWPAVSSVRFTSTTGAVASGGRDGVSIITMADTAPNRQSFEMAGGAIGLALFFSQGANLTEADVLFNPGRNFTTALESQEELRDSDLFDVQAVATHELGHSIGLDHSGVESSVMWSLASLAGRVLDPDDTAAVQSLYPVANGSGRLTGTVRVGGAAAFGAQVVAVAVDGPVISGLTLPDGSYAIENVPPGGYNVYVEPLDGPHSATVTDPCATFGNLGSSTIYGSATLTTNFLSTFLGGNQQPALVTVTGAQTAIADFDLPAASPALNPAWIGPAEGRVVIGAVPVDVAAGTAPSIALAGRGVDTVGAADVAVLGTGVVVDPSKFQRLNSSCNGQPLPIIVIGLAVAADARSGARSIALTSGGETALLTGALRVRGTTEPPAPTPTASPTSPPTQTRTPSATLGPVPCVGDCGQDGAVTVDELVRGINIALGNLGLEACPQFDTDEDGAVTVSELVQSVTAALGGCI